MASDIVLINALHLVTFIGSDLWGKYRQQPVSLSVYLHLLPSYLTTPGTSDDVLDSVHYGHLAKAITARVDAANSQGVPLPGFTSIDLFIDAVTQEAFTIAGDAASAVRVVVSLPKYIRLASGGFSVDVTTSRTPPSSSNVDISPGVHRPLLGHAEHSLPHSPEQEQKKTEDLQLQQQLQLKQQFHRSPRTVSIKDFTLPLIIGVNPPERKEKQLLRTHLTFYEHPLHSQGDDPPQPNYSNVIDRIAQVLPPPFFLFIHPTLITNAIVHFFLPVPFIVHLPHHRKIRLPSRARSLYRGRATPRRRHRTLREA